MRICTVEGCQERHRAKGLCKLHHDLRRFDTREYCEWNAERMQRLRFGPYYVRELLHQVGARIAGKELQMQELMMQLQMVTRL
jgi:hypothetical protein